MEAVVYLEDNQVVDEHVDLRLNTRTYTEKAIEFIELNSGKPFFLYLPYTMPHVPIYASSEFEGRSERGLYGDVVEEIDWSVGMIMDKLKELGLEENTIVIFTSDNGPWLVFGPEGGSADPLREGKQYTFEGGMRVPCILQWKGKVEGGQVYRELVSTMDIFPTFVKLAGGELPENLTIDGEDVSPILLENKILYDRELAYYMSGQLRAYRKGDWKLKLSFPGYAGSRGRKAVPAHDTLLFNLKKDMEEKHNLLREEPDRKNDLLEAMEVFRSDLGEVPPGLRTHVPADNSHYRKQALWLNKIREGEVKAN
jgi:arylsulfatase A